MNTVNKKVTAFAQVLLTFFVLMVIVLCVGFLARFTNNFTGDFKPFYVKYNDKLITSDTTNHGMEIGKEYRYDVGYTLGFLNKDDTLGYNVKVVPNINDKTAFSYDVDGEKYKYEKVSDLTDFFNIKEYDTYFTLTAIMDLPQMLKLLHPNSTEVTDTFATKGKGIDYFTLVVASEDNSTQIRISFHLLGKQSVIT